MSDSNTAECNEWRETVRDIFDELMFGRSDGLSLKSALIALIEQRHHAYFCEGRTMAEWERIKNG